MSIIKEDIESICGKVIEFPGLGCHFKINGIDCICLQTSQKDQLRFFVPNVANVPSNYLNDYMILINQMNCELRYIKVLLLDKGCIALNYDYKLVKQAYRKEVIAHIIEAISLAVGYITDSINHLF